MKVHFPLPHLLFLSLSMTNSICPSTMCKSQRNFDRNFLWQRETNKCVNIFKLTKQLALFSDDCVHESNAGACANALSQTMNRRMAGNVPLNEC